MGVLNNKGMGYYYLLVIVTWSIVIAAIGWSFV